MRWRAILLFGAPGSGKGTQGKVLGTIPAFCHISCGDVFRGMDLRTQVGQAFLKYSSAGQLVPDEVTVDLWRQHMAHLVTHDRKKLEERLKRRALRDNRLDDASDTVIHDRLQTYEKETKPVLEYYGKKIVKEVDAEQFPYEVTRDILNQVQSTKSGKVRQALASVGA